MHRAAAAAGYRNPAVVACFLQDERKYPLVAAAIREARARKELAAERKAADVLLCIHTAMFFCPADYFHPGGDGGWLIGQEAYRSLPQAIRCLVEEMELRTFTTTAGTSNMLWIRFVSKAAAMALAAKHQLGEKVNMNQLVNINWDALLARPPAGDLPDPIEEKIMLAAIPLSAEEPAALPAPPTGRLGFKPSRNGDGHE